MKNVYVDNLRVGDAVSGQTFAIYEAKRATDRNNNTYIDLVLSDKTGKIRAKVWSSSLPNVDKDAAKVGKVASIDGVVEDFKGNLQLNISSLRQVDETKVDEYIESSLFDPDSMMSELSEIIAGIGNSDIKQLLQSMLGDQDFAQKLKYWPAATSYHHEFRSGLLQHVLEGLALASGMERFYPSLDFDIVRAGIILHDLGKLEEIDASGFAPRYTVKGSVLGHLYIGTEMLDKYFPENGDARIKMHLKHIILSHHGEKEKGSPVLPATGEAMLVSQIDDTSAKARMAADASLETPDEIGMTPFNKHLQRWMWADNKPQPEEEAAIVYPEE